MHVVASTKRNHLCVEGDHVYRIYRDTGATHAVAGRPDPRGTQRFHANRTLAALGERGSPPHLLRARQAILASGSA